MLNLYNLEKIRELESVESPDRRHLQEWRGTRRPLLASLTGWVARLPRRHTAPQADASPVAAPTAGVAGSEAFEGGSPAG